jgi:hypothetical protein
MAEAVVIKNAGDNPTTGSVSHPLKNPPDQLEAASCTVQIYCVRASLL